MIHRLSQQQEVYGNLDEIWAFFATPQNLNTLTPSNLSFTIAYPVAPQMYAGQIIEYRIGVLPGIKTRWVTEITQVREKEFFVDEQRFGPYRFWHHEHHFAAQPDSGRVVMNDLVSYEIGYSFLGEIMHRVWIEKKLRTIFDYRAKKTAELFPERR